MSKLVFVVPRSRRFCGRATLIGNDGVMRAGPFRALATASVRVARKHGNADASPLLPFGHPPTGSYVVSASLPPGYAHTKRTRRYGRVGALLVVPRSGDALRAIASGRKLVAIHGGPRDTKRRLRPTRGGIRLSNANMKALLVAINTAQLDGDAVDAVEVVEVDIARRDARDRRGKHMIAPKPSKPTPSGVTSMFLLPFAIGASGKKLMRRDVLELAAILFGTLAVQACDRPSRCDALACDPYDAGDGGDADDAGCNPRGYVCDPYGGVG